MYLLGSLLSPFASVEQPGYFEARLQFQWRYAVLRQVTGICNGSLIHMKILGEKNILYK